MRLYLLWSFFFKVNHDNKSYIQNIQIDSSLPTSSLFLTQLCHFLVRFLAWGMSLHCEFGEPFHSSFLCCYRATQENTVIRDFYVLKFRVKIFFIQGDDVWNFSTAAIHLCCRHEHEMWKSSKGPAAFEATTFIRKFGWQQSVKSWFVRGSLTILTIIMLQLWKEWESSSVIATKAVDTMFTVLETRWCYILYCNWGKRILTWPTPRQPWSSLHLAV